MELEAEFDAQAFGSELRALKVRLDDDSGYAFVPGFPPPQTLSRVHPSASRTSERDAR